MSNDGLDFATCDFRLLESLTSVYFCEWFFIFLEVSSEIIRAFQMNILNSIKIWIFLEQRFFKNLE